MPIEFATPERKYPSAGRCIYCRRKALKLTKEHIMPFGLAANSLIMFKASCPKCQNATRDHETAVLRHMWWPFRYHIGAPTQSGERPANFRMMRSAAGTVTDGIIPPKADLVDQVLSAEYPLFYYAFSFEAPGIVTGRPAIQDKEHAFYLYDPPSFKAHLSEKQAFRLGPAKWQAFCLMLAKIAHAYAVAEIGIDAFRPSLALTIRNKMVGRPLYWIGCDGTPANTPTDSLHQIAIRRREIRGVSYVSVLLRLFACIGTPTYEIIVGELEPGFDKFAFLEQPLYCIDIKQPLPIRKLVPALEASGLTGDELDQLGKEDLSQFPAG